ncbi:22542_t:CDS:2, partial [Gigaspora rosea]
MKKTQHNLSMEWTVGFTQDQTNTNSMNTLQQNSAEPVKENKTSFGEDFNQCKDCYRASIRILSGNKLIDDFIKSTQTFYRNSKNRSKLEFIPYKQFTNIEYLNKGGFSVIYKPIWVDGPITRWCPKKKRFNRKGNYDV